MQTNTYLRNLVLIIQKCDHVGPGVPEFPSSRSVESFLLIIQRSVKNTSLSGKMNNAKAKGRILEFSLR